MSSSKWGVLFGVVLLMAGCATVENSTLNQLNGWTDRHYAEAMYQLGRPEYLFVDGPALVLAYGAVAQVPRSSFIEVPQDSLVAYDSLIVATAEVRPIPRRVAQAYDLLYVDREGLIYAYQSNESSREERVVFETNTILAGVGLLAGLLLLAVLTADSGY